MEPAATIIRALGGSTAVSRLLDVHRTTVAKWMRRRTVGGTDGRIPQDHHRALLDAAADRGLSLSADDFLPARITASADLEGAAA